jgi:hypothetical protein
VVSSAGAPIATRGWALMLPDPDRPLLRVIVGAEDVEVLTDALAGGRIAVTVACVRTLQTVQFKGTYTAPEPVTEEDLAAVERFCDAFFTQVEEVDGIPRQVAQRLVPLTFAAVVVDVEQVFDQTPGPSAGAKVEAKP